MTDLSELNAVIQNVKNLATTGDKPAVLQKDAFYLATLLEAVVEAATLRPCHVTGLHTPNHHINGSVCDLMTADAANRMLAALGVELERAPHELHPEGDCYSCHTIPSQQLYRDRMIASWEWAGRTPTAEMLEPASDAVLPGDTALVLSVLTTEYQTWQDATKKLSAILSERAGQREYFNSDRYSKVIARLAAEGRVQRRDISVRLAQEVPA